MKGQIDWVQILFECRNSIQTKIAPLLGVSHQLQPDLGIGAGGDRIKEVDLVAENAIMDILRKHEISFILISEESGINKYGRTPCDCYVTTDPIDGTTNLTRGIPFYATSIAVSSEPDLARVHTALVADLFHDVTFTAQKGKGAKRNNHKITPSMNKSLEEAVIGMDLNSYKIRDLIPRLNRLIERAKHIRHFGANALELCYVADGTTDAFIDIRGKLRTTDIAGASLVLEEAGSKMATPEGEPLNAKLDPKQKVKFIAASPEIYGIIVDLLRPERKRE